jgi:UDP-N-acetyl-D-mannosaminuronic acid transferase (WecB/TagA/CpsF family)
MQSTIKKSNKKMKQKETFKKLTLLNVSFLNIRMPQAPEVIDNVIKAGTQKTVYFVNADSLNILHAGTT